MFFLNLGIIKEPKISFDKTFPYNNVLLKRCAIYAYIPDVSEEELINAGFPYNNVLLKQNI